MSAKGKKSRKITNQMKLNKRESLKKFKRVEGQTNFRKKMHAIFHHAESVSEFES